MFWRQDEPGKAATKLARDDCYMTFSLTEVAMPLFEKTLRQLRSRPLLFLAASALLITSPVFWWKFDFVIHVARLSITWPLTFAQATLSFLPPILYFPTVWIWTIVTMLLLIEALFFLFRKQVNILPLVVGIPMVIFGLFYHADGQLSGFGPLTYSVPGWEIILYLAGLILVVHGIFWRKMVSWSNWYKAIAITRGMAVL